MFDIKLLKVDFSSFKKNFNLFGKNNVNYNEINDKSFKIMNKGYE